MEERTQVDDAHVSFAHAEKIARNDRVEIELVEFRLRDRLHARRALDRLFGEAVVAFLQLRLVVRLDRTEVYARLLEDIGRVVQMVGKSEHFVPLPEEDDRRWAIACERGEDTRDLRRAEALVVLDARHDEEAELTREQQLLLGQSESEAVEVVDLRANREDRRTARMQRAHRVRPEVLGERGAITADLIGIEDDEVEFVRRERVPLHEPRERGIGKGLKFRLCDQLLPRIEQRCRPRIDAATEFFGDRERGEAGAPERDEKLRFVVSVRLRERAEILIVERDLDAARAVLLAFAHDTDVERGQERDAENDR